MTIEQKILSRLEKGPLTHLQVWRLFKSYRLASYVNRLKLKGHRIVAEKVTKKGVTFASYTLTSNKK